jgi:hypothetical protein
MKSIIKIEIDWNEGFTPNEEQIEAAKISAPKILASKFLAWYIDDREDCEILGRRTAERMKATGYGDISVEQIFNECGYIPETICENYDGTLGEVECKQYHPSELEFINDLKK